MGADSYTLRLGDFDLAYTYGTAELGVEEFEGMGIPATTLRPQQFERSNGAWFGDSYYLPRPITIAGKIVAKTVDDAVTVRDALRAAVALEEAQLCIVEGNLTRYLSVRQSDALLVRDLPGHGNNKAWSMQLEALDPRITATNLTGSTGLPSSSGGWTFPVVLPAAIEATSSSGRVTLVNPGNVGGRVTVRITAGAGGLVGPRVTHVASGRTLQFATSLTIPEGNWIDVDMEAHTVLENSTASRNGWVTGRGWSFFEPGSNQWVFGAVSGNGTMAITATPSWM